MNSLIDEVKARRGEAAQKFASRFNQLEWKYLCSYGFLLVSVKASIVGASTDFKPGQKKH